MFIDFFYKLKDTGIPVSPTAFLTLHRALGNGLIGDHTDGHVDNLARFVGEGRLAIPVANGANDPNAAIYADAKARAHALGVDVADVVGRLLQLCHPASADFYSNRVEETPRHT